MRWLRTLQHLLQLLAQGRTVVAAGRTRDIAVAALISEETGLQEGVQKGG